MRNKKEELARGRWKKGVFWLEEQCTERPEIQNQSKAHSESLKHKGQLNVECERGNSSHRATRKQGRATQDFVATGGRFPEGSRIPLKGSDGAMCVIWEGPFQATWRLDRGS